MAQRRMFSLKVVDTDEFLDMGQGSQLLYFHMAMRADDDGFVNSPKKIMRFAGAKDDDMKVLIAKQFIIPFQSGVIVIRHWKENNYIQSDRKHDTIYEEELAQLKEGIGGVYEMDTKCIQDVSIMDTEDRLGKVRLGEKREIFSSLKETMGTAEGYQPDNHSPLDEKKRKNALAKKLGLVKTSPKVDFMYQVGNDFLKGYEYYTGVKYVGNVHLEQVARNLSLWFDEGETRETMQEMIDAFFEGKKGKDTVATPTAVFSPHTYNAWKQNRL